MRICSLFCGIGGIDLAFEQAGHSIIWANDNDKYACMTYRRVFPDVSFFEEDIRKVDKTTIPDCDIVTAGFPCQPFSVCGKQKGFSDDRGDLFFEICKVIDAKHPKIVFLENVANLTEHNNGKSFNLIHNELSERNYYIRYLIADACDYGIPQHRTRSYILAFSEKEACDSYIFPDKIPLVKHITDIIDNTVKADEKYYFRPGTAKHEKLNDYIQDNKQLYRFSDWGIQSSRDGISFTLKANMGTYFDRVPILKDNYGIRRITPAECLSLQGFPQSIMFDEKVPEKEQYKQAGNTVCVPVVASIAKALNR